MKKWHKAKYLIIGVLITALIGQGVVPASAANERKTIHVDTEVSIFVDDVCLSPTDANGNPVEPFIYDGTTYLPVRAVSQAFGKAVQWDGNTNSVYIGKHSGSPGAQLSSTLKQSEDRRSIVPLNEDWTLETIEVETGVTIYVDDVKLNLTDANGNPVEPFIYNGTTYLPVRAVSQALGKSVAWDEYTNSVYLGTHKVQPSSGQQLIENGKKPVYNVKYNQYGVPSEMFKYNYLPLTKNKSNKFTWWMPISKENMALYNFTNVADLPVHRKLRELTGVNMEYVTVGAYSMATGFAAMLASDSLTDLMSSAAAYYPYSMQEGVDDGYFANIYDYLEYMPCYQYTVNNLDDEVYNNAYPYDKFMPYMITTNISRFNTQGIIIRSDYLSKVGTSADNVRTVDEMYTLLKKFKAAGVEWPLQLSSSGDLFYGGISSAYGTIGNLSVMNNGGSVQPYVVNGKVRFPYCEDALKQYISTIAKWYKEGLIDPNWSSYQRVDDTTISAVATGRVGVSNLSISSIAKALAAADKNCAFAGIPNLVLKRGESHHMKVSTGSYVASGTFSVSADCENIPLLLSWCDYWFSDEGFMLTQYGIEGQSYTIDKNGQIWWTEEIYRNPQGLSITNSWEIYATSSMGRKDAQKSYYYPGGIKNLDYTKAWDSVPCDYAWKWPTVIQLTSAEQTEFAGIFANLSKLIVDNYAKFITGAKPLSEWDAYVSLCKANKLDRAIEIYQQAYNRWLAYTPQKPGN